MPHDFATEAKKPARWYNEACRLREAARLIHERAMADAEFISKIEQKGLLRAVDFPGVYSLPVFEMLVGYSLENLLKAILVFKDPGLVGEAKLDRKLASHNLYKLVRLAELPFDAMDVWYLKIFEERTVWTGRYHTSKEGPRKNPRSPFLAVGGMGLVDDLFNRFEQHLPEKYRKSDLIKRGLPR